MTTKLQMIGNVALLDLPDKVAFLSSRRISAATAAARNRWIIANCTSLVLGSLDPCGSLAMKIQSWKTVDEEKCATDCSRHASHTPRKGIIVKKRMVGIVGALAVVLAGCVQMDVGGPGDGFVSLAEAVPDAILEIRYYSTYNFVGARVDGYERPCALITKEAAAALKAASDDCVRRGYRLKIYDAYRPQRAVAHFVRWAKDETDTRMKYAFYPNLDKSVLFAQGYIAERSGHSRGSTVDLTLFDMKTGKEVDMGGTFDWFGRESHPDYKDITKEQFANRMLLREIMLAHGFKPLAEEWWHFTLKDEPYPDTYFDFPVR